MGSGSVVIGDGPTTGVVKEDTILSTTGDFDSMTDRTGTQEWTISSAPQFGTVSINANGTWVYTIQDNDPAFDNLDDNEFRLDSFEITLTISGASAKQIVQIRIDGFTDPCYAAGTRIETDRGYKAIETLAVGDKVRTLENGFQTVKWLGDFKTKAVGANAAVRIPRNAFGKGVPKRDVIVSPSHLVLLKNIENDALGPFAMSFVPAHFLTLPEAAHLFALAKRPERIEYESEEIHYYHFTLEKHDIVLADNLWSESLNMGALSMEAMHHKGGYSIVELEEIYSRLFTSAAPTLRKSEWIKICESMLPFAKSRAVSFVH